MSFYGSSASFLFFFCLSVTDVSLCFNDPLWLPCNDLFWKLVHFMFYFYPQAVHKSIWISYSMYCFSFRDNLDDLCVKYYFQLLLKHFGLIHQGLTFMFWYIVTTLPSYHNPAWRMSQLLLKQSFQYLKTFPLLFKEFEWNYHDVSQPYKYTKCYALFHRWGHIIEWKLNSNLFHSFPIMLVAMSAKVETVWHWGKSLHYWNIIQI